jgi:hypothetical protein
MSETERLEERLRAFAAVSDDSADWGDVLRRAGERLANPAFARRRLVLAVAAVVVLVGSLAVFLATLRTGGTVPPSGGGRTGHGPTGAMGATGPVVGMGPTGDRHAITIDDLRAEAPYVPLPSSELANDGTIGRVSVVDHASDSTIPEGDLTVVVYYPASRIRLVWTRGRLNVNASYLRMIDGVPAFLVPGYAGRIRVGPTGSTTTRAFHSLSTIYLPVGPDQLLTLEAPVPATELIDVAQTLRPWPGDASPASDLPPADPQPGPSLTFWDRPPFYGVAASSLADAAGSLAFRPVAPSSLGDPSAIFETDPAQTPGSGRLLSLRYDDTSKGRYWLLERPSLSTRTSLLSEIASKCTRKSGCKAIASMIDLGGGVSALSLENVLMNRIIWVQGGVYYEVVGAGTTFTPSRALAVAKATAAAG